MATLCEACAVGMMEGLTASAWKIKMILEGGRVVIDVRSPTDIYRFQRDGLVEHRTIPPRLEDYERLVKGCKCPRCGGRLPGTISTYDKEFDRGWRVKDSRDPVVMWVECPYCGKQNAIQRLMPPPEGAYGEGE